MIKHWLQLFLSYPYRRIFANKQFNEENKFSVVNGIVQPEERMFISVAI